MELYLVRHGESLAQTGADPSDPPLSALGRRQARRLGEALAGVRFDAIFCSYLTRAVETAAAVAALQAAAPPIRAEALLAECGAPASFSPCIGAFRAIPQGLILSGDAGPVCKDDAARAEECLRRFAYPFVEGENEPVRSVLIAAHGTFNAYLFAALIGVKPEFGRVTVSQGNACVDRFSLYYEQGALRVRLRCLNDLSHLPPEMRT